MKRIYHKETGKHLLISDKHAEAMTKGKHALYREDTSFDLDAAREAALKAKRDKEIAEAEAAEKAAAEAEVSIAKEEEAPKSARSSKKP